MALVTRLDHCVPCFGLLSPQVHFHNDLEVKADIDSSVSFYSVGVKRSCPQLCATLKFAQASSSVLCTPLLPIPDPPQGPHTPSLSSPHFSSHLWGHVTPPTYLALPTSSAPALVSLGQQCGWEGP